MTGRKILTFLLCTLLVFLGCVRSAEAQIVGGPTVTKLIVYNSTGLGVIVNIKYNSSVTEDGCPTTLAQLSVRNLTSPGTIPITSLLSSTTNGYFVLPKQTKVQITSTAVTTAQHGAVMPGTSTGCLQSLAFSFGQQVNLCPLCAASAPPFPTIQNPSSATPTASSVVAPFPVVPLGTNSYECNLNRQTGNEAADISCVNGANSILQQTYIPPAGGPYWNVVTCQFCGGNPLNQFQKCFTSSISSENSWINFGPPATLSAGTGCTDNNTSNSGTGLVSSTQFGCDNNCVNSLPATTNCERFGVQPYGATQCNVCPDTAPITCQGASGSPPILVNQFCRVEFNTPGIPVNSGCSFNRSAAGLGGCQPASNPVPPQFQYKYGGTVQITFKGPAVPQSCPNLTNPCPQLPKQSGGSPAAGTGGVVRYSGCLAL